MRKHAGKLPTIAIAAALLQACSSAAPLQERFSEATATTWRVGSDVLVFERTEARFSRSTRDYVYLGPVAVNRRGSYDYYLWIGIGSTLDRGFLAPEATLPSAISGFVEGEPLELTTALWRERLPGLADEAPYDPPVNLRWQLAARVTLDQIELIHSRGLDRLILHTADGNTREFQPWGDRAAWQPFIADSPR